MPQSTPTPLPVPTSNTITSTDGVELAVHDFGGEGPTILFAHATGFHGMVWSPIIAELVPFYRCVSIDFRGHGDSSRPEHGSFDWNGFGDDVEAVVDHLVSAGPLFGVGHSKGGAALLLAEQRRPGTFAGLYLYEPIVLAPEARQAANHSDHPLAVGARKRREHFESLESARANYAAKPPFDILAPEALDAYVAHGFADDDGGGVRLKCRGADESQVYASSGSHDAYDHLGGLRCPVTAVSGNPAEGPPAAFALAVAERAPAGTFVEHPELGHFGPLQAPATIAADIRAFFEPLTPVPHSADDVAPSVAATAPGVGHALGRFDAEVDHFFDRFLRGKPLVDRMYYSASALGDWSLIWHLAGAAQGTADRRDGWRRAVRLTMSLAVESALVNGVVKSFFRRERPVHDGERPHQLRMPVTSSFPSGHASSAFMAAHLLADRTPFGGAWYGVAAVVATSRVHVRIHHASDVIGGAALGLALGALVRRLVPVGGD